jgi:hypothetical protein
MLQDAPVEKGGKRQEKKIANVERLLTTTDQ